MPNPTKLIFVPPAGGTVDWSPYFLNISPIQRRIESDKPGEAGAIMFDTVTIEMPVSKTGSCFSESSLFGGSSKPKYHVQIKKHISGTDYQLFEGLIDLDSLKFTRHGTVQFDCYDKLSALKFYPTQPARLKIDIGAVRDYDSFYAAWSPPAAPTYQTFGFRAIRDGSYVDQKIFQIGEILFHPKHFNNATNQYDQEELFFIKKESYRGSPYFFSDVWTPVSPTDSSNKNVNKQFIYEKNFYGMFTIHIMSGGEAVALDALLMLQFIVQSIYPSVTIVNRTPWSTFPISLGFFEQTVNMPFDRPILEAIKYIASSMRVYVYFDRQGQFIIDKWPNFGSPPSSVADLSAYQTEDQFSYSWDKLVDKVTIETVAADGTKTEAVAGTEYKNPVNTLERTVFASDDSAQDIADDYYEFYGKRHRARSITRKLDSTVAQLDLTNWIDVGDKDFRDTHNLFYFIEKMSLDVMNDTVDLDLVSVKVFDV